MDHGPSSPGVEAGSNWVGMSPEEPLDKVLSVPGGGKGFPAAFSRDGVCKQPSSGWGLRTES